MEKSTVYSWRLSPELKRALTEAARENRESFASLLDRIAREWLQRSVSPDDEQEQRRLHQAAESYLGRIEGNDPGRAENAKEHLRARLERRRERAS